ncbi:FecR domain-containing protein [Telluria mixta]|uniref:FecR domain-containing protein n=1 Tax=Telluria mixta TaxID=34071 RepID=A0ABT2BT70_9BURK|nr:FecR domain-containing protein [Telluria mixta]MCS0628172.1 FecR domain-containing protein [Telluria mixta]WEM93713.1 FecR domain-containing protein [Telluria mixta]
MSTIDRQAMDWVVRQSDRVLDEAQRREFDAWFEADIRHQGAYLRAVAINRALNQATVQESLRPKRERLEAEWAGASWRRTGSRRAFLAAGGMATGVAVFALTRLFAADKTVLTTAKGEFRKVPLADKSVADINSGSLLEVRMTPQQRQVTLKKGEVWLEVAKDRTKPFIVEAGQVRVRAVGTAFGVRRFGNGAEVLVTEGTVEVWSNDGSARKRLVTAGERSFVPDQAENIAVARQPVEVQRKLAWREGKLIFDNQTLSEAVADFNRYSEKKIVIADPALGRRKLVGQYQIDAPELFAQDVGAYLAIPVTVTAETIVLGRG